MHHDLYSWIFTYCYIRDLVNVILYSMRILSKHKLSKGKGTLSNGFHIRSIAYCRLLASRTLEVLESFSKAPVLVKPVGRALSCTDVFDWRTLDLSAAFKDLLLLWGQAVICIHVTKVVIEEAAVGRLPTCEWRLPALPNAIIGNLLL